MLITGRTDTGREVRFHHDEIRDYHGRIRLEHGYALTIASAQGLTAERVFLYADAKPARQTLYPAATRHRERLDFYLDRRPLVLDIIVRAPEDAATLEVTDQQLVAHLGSCWSRGAPKAAALDYPALPPQLRPRPEGGEAVVRPRPAVALDRSITRAARAFRAATLEFRDGNTVLAVSDVLDAGEAQREREAKAQARLLRSAAPITAADPAGCYLTGCGLSLDQARAAGFRFHPGAPVTVDGETLKLPALLAPVRTPGGERAAAVHCFHLTPEGGLARIERQTHTRGEPGEGGVWLLNPAGAERVVLCTSIEDALTVVRILPAKRQAAIAVAATLSPERAGSIELPANAREVILIPDDLTGETAWAALKRRCEGKDTAFSVSRWFPDSASVHDALLLDGSEALTQTLGAALSSPLLHRACERLHHDWRRHIESAQAGGVLITQAPGYEGLTARLQSMTDALAGHHGPGARGALPRPPSARSAPAQRRPRPPHRGAVPALSRGHCARRPMALSHCPGQRAVPGECCALKPRAGYVDERDHGRARRPPRPPPPRGQAQDFKRHDDGGAGTFSRPNTASSPPRSRPTPRPFAGAASQPAPSGTADGAWPWPWTTRRTRWRSRFQAPNRGRGHSSQRAGKAAALCAVSSSPPARGCARRAPLSRARRKSARCTSPSGPRRGPVAGADGR